MRHWFAPILLLTVCAMTAQAQQHNITYATDEQCGCDIMYVDGIQTTKENGLYGFKMADGTVIAENKYKYVGTFDGEYCRVYLDEGMCGLIDRTGREVVPCMYDDVSQPAYGRIMVIKEGRCGYCDMAGQVVIPLAYWQASAFAGHIATVATVEDGTPRCLFIDTAGQMLFGRTFQNALPFVEGYAPVMVDGRWGMIDTTGFGAFPTIYPAMTRNANGHFFAGTEHGLALFDYTMRPLTEFVYDYPGEMREGRVSVSRNGKYGFLDSKGREVVECLYDETGIFQQGRTMVRIGDKYGIVDSMGREVLPLEYERRIAMGMTYMYYDGRALVEKDGHLGFVDLDGNIVMPLILDQAYEYSQGLASVKKAGRWGYIDTTGDIYIPPVFDLASPFRWGRADVVYNGIRSKINIDGRCVANCNGIIAWREIRKE